MLVAGSLAGIDEALKRYALGVDEWREAMRSLRDAERKKSGILCETGKSCAFFFCFLLFHVSYILFFLFRVTRLIKASNSKKIGAGNIRESLLLNHQRFPSSSSLPLSVGGESPSRLQSQHQHQHQN